MVWKKKKRKEFLPHHAVPCKINMHVHIWPWQPYTCVNLSQVIRCGCFHLTTQLKLQRKALEAIQYIPLYSPSQWTQTHNVMHTWVHYLMYYYVCV